MASITPDTPIPPPIASVIRSPGYHPVPFWAARFASILAVIGGLWVFHNILQPKLGIYDVRLLVLSLLFATLAVSLNLINGVTGQFSIGHAAFYLIGAITAGKLSNNYYAHNAGHINPQVWLILMVVAGGISAALAGLLVGLPSLRLRGDYLAVATLGFGEIVNVFLRNQDGREQAVTLTIVVAAIVAFAVLYGYIRLASLLPVVKGGFGIAIGIVKFIVCLVVMRLSVVAVLWALGPTLDGHGRLDTGGATGLQDVPKLTPIYFIILLLIGTIAISRNLLKSAHGLSFLSVREDELAADATGVSTTKVKVTAFALGAAIAGMTGALFAHYNGIVNPDDFKMDVSFMLVAMVVIGGTGSITGAALAGMGLKLLEEGLRKLPDVNAVYLFSLIVSAVLIFALYRFLAKRGLIKLDGALRITFSVFGAIAVVALGYLGFLVFKSDLSVVIKVAIIVFVLGAAVGLLFTSARQASLPRFGMLAVSLVALKYLTPVVAAGMHALGPVERVLGATTYKPADLRWAIFSIALVFVMILRSQGLMGHQEFSWTFVESVFKRRRAVSPA